MNWSGSTQMRQKLWAGFAVANKGRIGYGVSTSHNTRAKWMILRVKVERTEC
jgi:hypothetical protein